MIDHAPGAITAPPALALVVSANDWNARAVESILDPSAYVTLRATTRSQAVQFARNASPDIVIVHGDVADQTLDDTVRALVNDNPLGPTCPLIVIATNGGHRERRLDLQRVGAWYVVGDPIDSEALALLFVRLLGARREVRRIADRVHVDAETGVYNERGLLRRAAELGAHATRFHESLACIALRPLAEGEEPGLAAQAVSVGPIAVHLARVIAPLVRMSDTLGHLRPREFGVVASGGGDQSALRLVERMRLAVENSPLVMGGLIRRLSLAAAICMVPDFADSAVAAPALLSRVADLMRDGASQMERNPIRVVEPVPLRRD